MDNRIELTSIMLLKFVFDRIATFLGASYPLAFGPEKERGWYAPNERDCSEIYLRRDLILIKWVQFFLL